MILVNLPILIGSENIVGEGIEGPPWTLDLICLDVQVCLPWRINENALANERVRQGVFVSSSKRVGQFVKAYQLVRQGELNLISFHNFPFANRACRTILFSKS